MKSNEWVALSQRFYRWLLHWYPQTYRANYESEMFRVFTDQCREADKGRGRRGLLALWVRTLVDVVITVIREHLSDPRARVGLLEAVPNVPLPWKGVLLVLIPGLIFFISQIEQVTASNDWFFLASHRAGYFLILPVLLVWLLTRRFPVWGLIPLGLLYRTIRDYYTDRFDLGSLPFIGHWFAGETTVVFGVDVVTYTLKYKVAVVAGVILVGILMWHHVRRGQISRSAWRWLGLYGLLIVLGSLGEVYSSLDGWPPPESKQYFFQVLEWHLYESLPFLLLVFIGMLLARKFEAFSFLLILGYLLPTVLFGRFETLYESVPFYVVSVAVLAYRFVVALVAPVWLVRAASIPGRQRAAAIPVAIAILCHLSLDSITFIIHQQVPSGLLGFVLFIWGQLIMAAGLGLALALYLPRERDEVIASPPGLVATTE